MVILPISLQVVKCGCLHRQITYISINMMRRYKILWKDGSIEDNVMIANDDYYTWGNVDTVLVEYQE